MKIEYTQYKIENILEHSFRNYYADKGDNIVDDINLSHLNNTLKKKNFSRS